MEFLTDAIRTSERNGKHIIAFAVDRESYLKFLDKFGSQVNQREDEKSRQRFSVSIDKFFLEGTRAQQDFFHGLIRLIAREMKWDFDFTKEHILTHEGIEVTAVNESGIRVAQVVELTADTSEGLEEKEQKLKQEFRKKHLYLKPTPSDNCSREYVIIKGISHMDSKELWDVIERVLRVCYDMAIPTIPAKEYKRLRENI